MAMSSQRRLRILSGRSILEGRIFLSFFRPEGEVEKKGGVCSSFFLFLSFFFPFFLHFFSVGNEWNVEPAFPKRGVFLFLISWRR